MEAVAETTARCFAKTIPKRDLELSLDKWKTRGEMLVRRLCTSYSFNEVDIAKALALFKGVIGDITGVSMSVCLKGPVKIAGQGGPRMISGFEPASLVNLREYTGYY
jgi:hypothetical protein